MSDFRVIISRRGRGAKRSSGSSDPFYIASVGRSVIRRGLCLYRRAPPSNASIRGGFYSFAPEESRSRETVASCFVSDNSGPSPLDSKSATVVVVVIIVVYVDSSIIAIGSTTTTAHGSDDDDDGTPPALPI